MPITESICTGYKEFIQTIRKFYKKALPDTLVWRRPLAYNEPLVENYLRHPAFADYPVVGVSWLQANDFCAWRTNRVNELILIEKGILEFDPSQQGENNFDTEAYLLGQYEGYYRKESYGRPRS